MQKTRTASEDEGLRITRADSEKPRQHLLVAVAPNSTSEHLVRWTHQLAESLGCKWVAVYVQTSSNLAQSDQLLLVQIFSLARDLGAEVITTKDENEVRGLLRTAAGRNITQIVVGKTESRPFLRIFHKDDFLRRLIAESGDAAVQVVPVPSDSSNQFALGPWMRRLPIIEYALGVGVVAGVTCLGLVLDPLVGYHAIAWVFLSAVIALAFFVGRGPALLAATLSALLWSYFFVEPRYSFYISSREDRELFVLYFVVALVLGQLTSRIRRQEKAEREREERTKSLYLLTRELTEAGSFKDLLSRSVRHLEHSFNARAAILLCDSQGRLGSCPANAIEVSDDEFRFAQRTVEQSRGTSNAIETFPQTNAFIVVLGTYGDIEGVVVIRFRRFPISLQKRNLLVEQAQQIGMALHRYRTRELSEKARVLAESERLSKTLLDAMSHEVRTPLAIIQAAVANLVQFGKVQMPAAQSNMISEIQEATERLNRLVGEILQITRLECGYIKPKLGLHEIHDLFRVAQHEAGRDLRSRKFTVDIAPGLPQARMDFELTLSAVTNLLSNAGRHTPENTEVRLSARVENEALLLSVADSGPGIPADSLPSLFDKFYRAPSAKPGGVGLGLSVVKGFVEAQGGKVTAANRPEGGAVFTITLPLEKPEPNAAAGEARPEAAEKSGSGPADSGRHERATLRACLRNPKGFAAGLLPGAFVGSDLTARSGDARSSPPRLRPKSLAAKPFGFFRHALRDGLVAFVRDCPKNYSI